MQQLRLFFAMALLYMFRVTIPPILFQRLMCIQYTQGDKSNLVCWNVWDKV